MSSEVQKFRVCNVGYLNSSPYRVLARVPWIDYQECEPSECARRLFEAECDLACLPTASFAASGELTALDFGIISPNEVRSVMLFSSSPLEELDTILIDEASETSVVLLRLLLKERLGKSADAIRYLRRTSTKALEEITERSAALVIGDEALKAENKFLHALDLGSAWRELTGKPFVFALWAGRRAVLSKWDIGLVRALISESITHKQVYAREWAEAHKYDRQRAESYLDKCIAYKLDTEASSGLAEFISRAQELNLVPETAVEFYRTRLQQKLEMNGHSPAGISNSSGNEGINPSASSRLDKILKHASQGKRISIADGLELAMQASTADLSLASDAKNKLLHPTPEVSYIVDRNVNYTNICNVYCRFCAFYSAPGKAGGYVLSKDELGQKIEETLDAGGIQVLLQGGLNPELGIEYYEDLFSWIKETYPVNLHALSSDEVWHISRVSSISIEETLKRLIAAGMDSLPGGGGEILVDRVRRRIARLKTTSEEWLDVHRVAHGLGLTSTCTMMFGVKETWLDRLNHLYKLRKLQDETQGFTAFIAWPFQEENTKLKKGNTTSLEYLRVQAISRLFLDNIPNIQSSWVTQGPSVGQIALFFGANDFGSTMFEENVVSAAGTTYRMNSETIENHILHAGFEPFRRNVHYERQG